MFVHCNTFGGCIYNTAMSSSIDRHFAGLSKIACLAILRDIAVIVGSKWRMNSTILPNEKTSDCIDWRPLPATISGAMYG